MFKTLHKQQKGFTLIEVLVVVGILAILLAITLIALNPSAHFKAARDTQRSSDVTAILDAIYQYQAANKGSLPASLASVSSSSATHLGKDSPLTLINVCTDLVPTYIADLPLDPTSGSKTPSGSTTVCAATTYDTGYTIQKSATGNRYTIAAPSAENGSAISVTR